MSDLATVPKRQVPQETNAHCRLNLGLVCPCTEGFDPSMLLQPIPHRFVPGADGAARPRSVSSMNG